MRRFQLWLIGLGLALSALPVRAQDRVPDHLQGPVKVVASFSILGDFAKNVGGDRVEVMTLVGPDSDVHIYTPAPVDAKKIAAAQLVIINGLGLEGWLPRLLQSSGSKAMVVTATDGITPIKTGSAADAHAWQSVVNAKRYVLNIRDALVATDPADAAVFRANADGYLAKLDQLDRDVRAAVAQIEPARRRVISTHGAFSYFAAAYDVEFVAPLGISTDSEPSARDIAGIITKIRTLNIPAVFLENMSDDRLIRRISAETGIKVGGTLYSDSLSAENGNAPTYIDMVRHNIKVLTTALEP